ncbi:hypothetical protein [Magnetovibrio blakemorei]|uniref:Uncharacterized protein n=1 Tax=Magnetovibrio blakemorei TaxID=28181 RepID=A0A1E5Q9G9_9PROT|nr:hypothetical protein [Magnetovibrio blakemorei]OEJ68220.1 hypothetical protein BEN30_06770 [Magnetovibrio blakemorei]
MARQQAQNTGQEELRRRGRSNLTWILLVLTCLVVLAGPTMVVLFLGMLPTVVALIIDRTKQKSTTFCVGSVNFIGVFPFIMTLWTDINTFDAAILTVSDIFNLLVMYSAAAFGWFLFLTMPPIISSFVIVLQQRKVAQLRGEQKDLIEEWGTEVASIVEMRKTAKQEQHMEHGVEGTGHHRGHRT